jgi:predicted DNA-binding transcriptional regulator AlpA
MRRKSRGRDLEAERYVGIGELTRRFGVCGMTVRRWWKDPAVAFPRPVKLGQGGVSRNYWWLPAVEEWAASREHGEAA